MMIIMMMWLWWLWRQLSWQLWKVDLHVDVSDPAVHDRLVETSLAVQGSTESVPDCYHPDLLWRWFWWGSLRWSSWLCHWSWWWLWGCWYILIFSMESVDTSEFSSLIPLIHSNFLCGIRWYTLIFSMESVNTFGGVSLPSLTPWMQKDGSAKIHRYS